MADLPVPEAAVDAVLAAYPPAEFPDIAVNVHGILDAAAAPIHPTTSHGLGQGWPHVVGHCPACGSSSLFLGEGGHVTCARLDCPNPAAVNELLDDRETEHIVEFGKADFTVRHPLRERIGDALMACDLHQYVAGLDGPPVLRGRYRARWTGTRWTWEPVDRGEVGRG